MLKTYVVFDREIRADPELSYLKVQPINGRSHIINDNGVHMNFEPIDVEGFMSLARDLPDELQTDFYEGIALHLMENRSALGFVEATEGDYHAQKIVPDGPVTPPTPLATEEVKDGLKNTIYLFEQLQGYQK